MISKNLTRIIQVLSALPPVAGLTAIAVGASTLAAASFGEATTGSAIPPFAVTVRDAVGLAVAGLLLLIARRSSVRPWRWLQIALATALTAFGVWIATSSAGVVPATAPAFMLFGAAMLADRRARGWLLTLSRALALILFLIAFTALLGHWYGAPELYLEATDASAMAPVPAFLFALSAAAIVWLHPYIGFPALIAEDSFIGAHVRSLLPMVVGAPVVVGAAVAAGYGILYEGELAVVLTSLGSILAAATVGVFSTINLRRIDSALYVKDRALAAASNGLVITDHCAPDEPIIFVNPAFTAITGYPPEEAIGRNCRFLNEGVESRSSALDEIRQAIAAGDDCLVEFENRRKDGGLFWNRLNLAPVEDHHGTVTHFVGVLDDVTESIEREEQLRDAIAAAKTANDAQQTFIRLIGHELRTPLNAALTWLRLMEIDRSPETIDKGLSTVIQSIDSQSRLIDDLVDAARFASAGVRLETEEADVARLVRAVVDELRPATEPSRSLALSISRGDYTATVDPLRIQQILRNLISNANKFTPDGGRIEVSLAQTTAAIHLTVADSGRGLDAGELENVFELFWRGDEHAPGLGVGLSIVRSLVDAHGGSVEVSSDGRDRGTRFDATLPRNAATPERVPLGGDDIAAAPDRVSSDD